MDPKLTKKGQTIGRDFALISPQGPKVMVSFDSEWSLGGASPRALPCLGRDLGRFLKRPGGWTYEPSAKAYAQSKRVLFYRNVFFTDLDGTRTRFDLRNRNPFPLLQAGTLAFGGLRSAFLKIEVLRSAKNLVLYVDHSAHRPVQGWHIALVDRRITLGPHDCPESEIEGFDDFLSLRRSGSGDIRLSKLSEGEILHRGSPLGHAPLEYGMRLSPGPIEVSAIPWLAPYSPPKDTSS